MHNLVLGADGAHGPGRNCMNQNSTNVFNANALFPTMHAAGYKTGHFGKLTNDQAAYWCPPKQDATTTLGFSHISTSCASVSAPIATASLVTTISLPGLPDATLT